MTRVPFRMMGSSCSAFLWVGGTFLGVFLIAVYFFVTDPPNRPYTALIFTGLLFCAYVIVRHQQWLEVGPEGTALVQRRAFGTRRVDLRTATEVRVRGAGGTAQVVAAHGGQRVDGRRTRRHEAFAGLMIHSLYATGTQPPEVLHALVDGLEGSRAKGAKETQELLRAQVAHLEAGGPVLASPLAPLCAGLVPLPPSLGGADSPTERS